MCYLLYYFYYIFGVKRDLASTNVFYHFFCGCSGVCVCGGDAKCFMHASICILKAKALGMILKMQKVFISVYLFMMRWEKQHILEQIHVIIEEAPSAEVIFQDMHFNDSLRCCCRNGYTQLHVCNTCNIKVERKTGVFPYITRVASSLYISPL